MNDASPKFDGLLRLAEEVCAETVSAEDLTALDALLLSGSEFRRDYLDYCTMHMALGLEMQAEREVEKLCRQIGAEGTPADPQSAPHTAISISPIAPISSTSGSFSPFLHDTVVHFSSGWPVAYVIATAIFAIGLIVGALVHVSPTVQFANPTRSGQVPSPQSQNPDPSSIVGRITAMVDCEWAGKGMTNSPLSPLHSPLVSLGDKLALKSGLLEITYDTGAKVILQGPVTYEVESPAGGYLSVGKLTARLDSRSEISNLKSQIPNQKSEIRDQKLFAVRTPTALVTDLGTEFGVEVNKDGETHSHVFRGLIRVQKLSADGTASDAAKVLHENQSVRVAKDLVGEIVVAQTAKASDFIREVPKRSIKTLDLVDVVAGGNGFSSKRGRGIDPTSGRVVEALWVPPETSSPMNSDGRYHRVPTLPFVDGVFIPRSDAGGSQVDSANHVFDGFGNLVGSTWQYIWAGDAMPLYPTEVCGVDYASPGHGLVLMHANNAITFDLDAVRQANPGCRLLRFRAIVANVAKDRTTGGPLGGADAWVLVDGQSRFARWDITSWPGAIPIAVPFGQKDRFLTLAVTDGGNGCISSDWIIFGDPQIEMLSLKAKEPAKKDGH